MKLSPSGLVASYKSNRDVQALFGRTAPVSDHEARMIHLAKVEEELKKVLLTLKAGDVASAYAWAAAALDTLSDANPTDPKPAVRSFTNEEGYLQNLDPARDNRTARALIHLALRTQRSNETTAFSLRTSDYGMFDFFAQHNEAAHRKAKEALSGGSAWILSDETGRLVSDSDQG